MSRVDVPSLTSVLSEYDRDGSVNGEWFAEDFHYLDLSLSGRPPGAWGRFPDVSNEMRPVGKVLFIPANHRYRGQGGKGRQRSVSVFLRPRLLDDEPLLGTHLGPVLEHCLHLRSRVIDELLVRIGRETENPGFASALMLEGLGLNLLVETARLLHALKDETAFKGGLSAWRLRLIKERVRSDASSASLEELAKLCKLSRRHLIRAFRHETGQTIGQFVQRSMVEHAQSLLSANDRPIKAIAAELGFKSPAAFSASFHRATGLTPREYRARKR